MSVQDRIDDLERRRREARVIQKERMESLSSVGRAIEHAKRAQDWDARENPPIAAELARTEALVSIAETLKLLIQPDPATRETWICHDCSKTAGPSCSYFGHGITQLGDLMDNYEGADVIERNEAVTQLAAAREEIALKEEALAVVVEDRDRQHAQIQKLIEHGTEAVLQVRALRGLIDREYEHSIARRQQVFETSCAASYLASAIGSVLNGEVPS